MFPSLNDAAGNRVETDVKHAEHRVWVVCQLSFRAKRIVGEVAVHNRSRRFTQRLQQLLADGLACR